MMRTLVLAYLAVFFLICSPLPSVAEEKDASWVHEIRFGILDHDTDGLWSGFKREDGIDINAEILFTPSFDTFLGSLRPHLGATINTQGYTSKVYAGGTWQYEWESGLFLEAGLGIAAHNGESETDTKMDYKELGSSVLFRVHFEGGYAFNEHHRLSIMFDHISNGYLYDPNEGMDTLGLRYGYRF